MIVRVYVTFNTAPLSAESNPDNVNDCPEPEDTAVPVKSSTFRIAPCAYPVAASITAIVKLSVFFAAKVPLEPVVTVIEPEETVTTSCLLT